MNHKLFYHNLSHELDLDSQQHIFFFCQEKNLRQKHVERHKRNRLFLAYILLHQQDSK